MRVGGTHMAGYTPMIRQYLKIKAKYDDCFLFFRLGDFYELFFNDAEKAAQVLEITLTSRDGGGGDRIPMCGVPYHSADAYIAKLVERGHKVAICEQVEDPAQAKGVVRREVVQVVTPGTVMSDHMLHEKQNNFIVTLCKEHEDYGLAAADVSTGEFRYTTAAGLEAVLDEMGAYAPAEILLHHTIGEHDEKALRKRFAAPVTALDEMVLELTDARTLLEKQVRDIPASLLHNDLAVLTTGHLLHYLMQTQKRSLLHLQKIIAYDTKGYMVLDERARRNLELTATIRDNKRHGSLLWLLDQTATAMGGRLLKQWLDKPLYDRQAIEARLSAVEAFVGDMLATKDAYDLLKDVYDVERLAGRIACGTANARDLIALKRSLQTLPRLQETVQRTHAHLPELSAAPDLCQDLKKRIAETLVEDPPVSVKEGGLIRRGFHDELDELIAAKNDGRAWVSRLEQEEREKTGIKSLKVGYNRVFGYYIEVTKANLHLLPEGRYERKQTLANAERFITSELKEKEALILNAEERSAELEYELFVRLRDELGRHVGRLQTVANWVATIDVWQSLATVSARYGYVRPQIEEAGALDIAGGRHPVVEQVLEDEPFTPNDTVLDHNRAQIMLITGPNMAGKSTYMRQVALIVIMAHMGCFVPAEKARIPLVDRIFTRIGAADDLAGGQSTFMVEMLETKRALTQATERSLILLDEIGRGTSTYDGMAIAHAIIEYIHETIGAKTLFSTHYHELTRLAERLEKVTNVHARCEERDGELLFLHRIEPGRADRSYGVHVARLSGMPAAVIDRAQQVLHELESRQTAADAEDVQLSLFSMDATPSRIVEEEVLADLLAWDVNNRTPLETAQFLASLKKRLAEEANSQVERLSPR